MSEQKSYNVPGGFFDVDRYRIGCVEFMDVDVSRGRSE